VRIVSLIASATETVDALGLSRFLVGRSHECDYPPWVRSLPACTKPRFRTSGDSRSIDEGVKNSLREAGSVYEVLEDALASLRPDVILTQSQCRVCAASVEDVERAVSAKFDTHPRVVALEPNCLADIFRDIGRIADACGVPDRRDRLAGEMKRRMDEVAARAKHQPERPRVACIEWQEPLMAAGNWVPELVEMAGGRNLFGAAGAHSPWISWDDLVDADPDVLLVMPCGYGLERTRSEMYWLDRRQQWGSLRAVRNGSTYIADGNLYFHRPGPRIVDSLLALAEVLHPRAFPPSLKGKAWLPYE